MLEQIAEAVGRCLLESSSEWIVAGSQATFIKNLSGQTQAERRRAVPYLPALILIAANIPQTCHNDVGASPCRRCLSCEIRLISMSLWTL